MPSKAFSADDLFRISRVRHSCSVGEVRRVRETAMLSQSDLARAIGVTVSQVSRIENGLQSPRSDTALKLDAVLSALKAARHEDVAA